MIFTCSYSEVPADYNGLLLQISQTKPKNFSVHTKIEQLCPDTNMLQRYKNMEKKVKNDLEKAKNELIYTEKYLEKLKKYNPQSLLEYFNTLSKQNNNKDILLLCFEKHNDFCHRNILADYINSSFNKKIIQDYPTYLKQQKFITDIKKIISFCENDENFKSSPNYKNSICYLKNLILPAYINYNYKSPYVHFSFNDIELEINKNLPFTVIFSFMVDLDEKKDSMNKRANFYYDCINSLILDKKFDGNTTIDFNGKEQSFFQLLEYIDTMVKKEIIYKDVRSEHEKIMSLARQHTKTSLENLELFM